MAEYFSPWSPKDSLGDHPVEEPSVYTCMIGVLESPLGTYLGLSVKIEFPCKSVVPSTDCTKCFDGDTVHRLTRY